MSARFVVLFLGVMTLISISGCTVGEDQERDLRLARERACQADPHCLHP